MHEDGHGDAHARVGGGVEAEEQEQLGDQEAEAQVAVDGGALTAETCRWGNDYSGVSLIETDRNPNFDYRQKHNILLNPKYSANCRIPEYYAPTVSGQLFGFGRIFG